MGLAVMTSGQMTRRERLELAKRSNFNHDGPFGLVSVTPMRPARRERPALPEFPEGAPCWADARLADVEAGKRFYGDLFGWTFDEGAGAERDYYTAAYSEDRAVAALAPANLGVQWRMHLAVRDAYAAAERVSAAGGHIEAGPLSGGTEATVALARGPEGRRSCCGRRGATGVSSGWAGRRVLRRRAAHAGRRAERFLLRSRIRRGGLRGGGAP